MADGQVDVNKASLKTPPGNLHRKRGRAFQNETTFFDKNRDAPISGRPGLCGGHPAIGVATANRHPSGAIPTKVASVG